MAKPSNINLYLAASIACLTASLFGYSVGFIGGVLVLPSFLHTFHLDTLPDSALASAESQIVTLWLVGALFGVLLGMPVCSRFGRKGCLLLSALLYVTGAGIQLGTPEGKLVVFEVGRLLNGLGVGAGTLASPIYISEISPPSERGMLMSGYQTFLQISALIGFWGAFASNAVCPPTSPLQWQLPVSIQLLPGLLLLGGILLIPESPIFILECGHLDAAACALAWLRSQPAAFAASVADELGELDALAHAARFHPTSFWSELRTNPSVRRRLHVGIGLMVAQNMVGLNALNYYAPVIFMSAGFTSVSASLLLTGIFGLVKLASALAFMFVFVRVRGNRFWLKVGCAVCGGSMLVLAYCVRMMPTPAPTTTTPTTTTTTTLSAPSNLTLGGVVSVLMVYVFAFAFGVSLGPISWNVCAEIFPAGINASCCAVTTCTQWAFQIVIAAATPLLIQTVGWATYAVYAAFCAASYVWVVVCVPETRGVGLGGEMDGLFEGGKGEIVVEVVGERTALLRRERDRRRRRRRRSSVSIAV